MFTEATRLVTEARRVVASVAPSYAGVFEPWEQKRLPSALRRFGFRLRGRNRGRRFPRWPAPAPRTCANDLRPVRMSGHSCLRGDRYGDVIAPATPLPCATSHRPCWPHATWIALVAPTPGTGHSGRFIGPCVAKKAEAERARLHRAWWMWVLTFEELANGSSRNRSFSPRVKKSQFDEAATEARLYPLPTAP